MNCNNQGSEKCIDFNEDQIKEYLEELKKLILSDQYIISKHSCNE